MRKKIGGEDLKEIDDCGEYVYTLIIIFLWESVCSKLSLLMSKDFFNDAGYDILAGYKTASWFISF